ncbi:MAG: tRNA (adenosine(37)-N6)-dimethylallyltransferase MiaA [Gemmatimonadota bacterium]
MTAPAASGRLAVVLAGPTATGKSELAVLLAERVGGEIISADSRQAYRGLRIGTAAPSEQQLARVPHHGVGFLAPDERYGAGRFSDLARVWMAGTWGRGLVPIVAGGTGFFLRAVWQPLFGEPELEPARRRDLETALSTLSPERLAAWASRLDPDLAERLPNLDPQRSLRAIEVALLTGRPLSSWQAEAREGRLPEPLAPGAPVYVLELPAEEHRARIRARAEHLLDSGWTDEVRTLLETTPDMKAPAFTSIGYRHVANLVRGELPRAEALERICQDTWQYARRQRTWCRHQLPPHAVRLDAELPSGELADRIVSDLQSLQRQTDTTT